MKRRSPLRPIARTLTPLAAAAFLASGAWAQVYRWIDPEGKVHYSQTPPPAGARNVQKKAFSGNDATVASDLPYATQQASRNFPVTLRTAPDCGSPCEQARAALVRRGVPFREISVVTQDDLEELKKLSGASQLPHLTVGRQMQSGFLDSLYNDLLDTAGYPATGPQLPIDKLRKTPTPQGPSRAGARPVEESGTPQDPAAVK